MPTNSDEAIKLVLLVVSPANAIKTGSGVNSEVPGKKMRIQIQKYLVSDSLRLLETCSPRLTWLIINTH